MATGNHGRNSELAPKPAAQVALPEQECASHRSMAEKNAREVHLNQSTATLNIVQLLVIGLLGQVGVNAPKNAVKDLKFDIGSVKIQHLNTVVLTALA